jgi:hypothetical protein
MKKSMSFALSLTIAGIATIGLTSDPVYGTMHGVLDLLLHLVISIPSFSIATGFAARKVEPRARRFVPVLLAAAAGLMVEGASLARWEVLGLYGNNMAPELLILLLSLDVLVAPIVFGVLTVRLTAQPLQGPPLCPKCRQILYYARNKRCPECGRRFRLGSVNMSHAEVTTGGVLIPKSD